MRGERGEGRVDVAAVAAVAPAEAQGWRPLGLAHVPEALLTRSTPGFLPSPHAHRRQPNATASNPQICQGASYLIDSPRQVGVFGLQPQHEISQLRAKGLVVVRLGWLLDLATHRRGDLLQCLPCLVIDRGRFSKFGLQLLERFQESLTRHDVAILG